MKRALVALIIFLASSALAEESRPTGPDEVAKAITRQLTDGWRCVADHRVIVISRQETVTLLNSIGLPDRRGRSEKAFLDEYGRKSPFLIVLTFRPRLKDEEYKTLLALRQAALKRIKDNTTKSNEKDMAGLWNETIDRLALPEFYNEWFSVYVHRTDSYHLKIYQESAAKERDIVWQAVTKCFSKYPNPNPPINGTP